MKSITDTFVLNNGYQIPCIGYGTYLTTDDIVSNAVKKALHAGYRHIDTAAFYGNEPGIGSAIAPKSCGIPREQLFITSKVWNTDRGYQKTLSAFEKTLQRLGLDYLDLYLIHWPANKKQFGEKAAEINAETWAALETLYTSGKVKAIGLSNFLPHHIEELLKTASIKPMVDQIEYHPGWPQTEVVDYCRKEEILVEAWSPLGRTAVLDNDTLKEIAAHYGKTTAQICIRWALQHGIVPLPKSVTPDRMIENTQVFDFSITPEDMKRIDELRNIGGKCTSPDEIDF